MHLNYLKSLSLLVYMMVISGCTVLSASQPAWVAAVAGDGPGDPALLNPAVVQVRNLPKSRSGNRSSYTVFDQEYRVMDSAEGFAEWGVASWYGKKFHGRATSSGEIYDMHQLSAAHKHLPLPTFVRVTRIDNGQSVIVKVNDRGPFVDDRSIDLSYAAAAQLDMLESGKTDVFIEALSTHDIDTLNPNAPPITIMQVDESSTDLAKTSAAGQYVQVGAFSDEANANRLVERIRGSMLLDVGISHDPVRQLYRVRIGPLDGEFTVREVLDSLATAGVDGYKVLAANP